jgi:hypothetical protein
MWCIMKYVVVVYGYISYIITFMVVVVGGMVWWYHHHTIWWHQYGSKYS